MTDARLRGEWLNSMRFDDLSDAAWRVFTRALMWSGENGTDGLVPARYLKMLHPDGDQPTAFSDLVNAGLWSRTDAGYQLTDWDGALGQSTAEQVETYKANARARQRKYRKQQQQRLAKSVGFGAANDVDSDVTSDVTRDVRQYVGIGEGEGEGRGNYATPIEDPLGQFVDQHSGELLSGHIDWKVAQPGSGGLVVNGKCVGWGWGADAVCERPHTEPEQARIDAARRSAA